MINKDGNGKSQTQKSSFLSFLKLHLWCFKCFVKKERGTENIFDRKLPLLPFHYFKRKTGSRVERFKNLCKIRIRRILNYAGLPSKESELFFLKILNSEGFEDSE